MVKRIGAPQEFTNQAINQFHQPPFIACCPGVAHPFGPPQNFTGRPVDGSLSRRGIHLCNSAASLMTFKNSMDRAPNPPHFFSPVFWPTDSPMNALFNRTLNPALMRVAQGGLSWQVRTEAPDLSALLFPAIT